MCIHGTTLDAVFWVNTAAHAKNEWESYHGTYHGLAEAPTASVWLTGALLYYLCCIGQWISLWRSVLGEKELHRCTQMQIDVKLCMNISNMLLSDFDRWPAR